MRGRQGWGVVGVVILLVCFLSLSILPTNRVDRDRLVFREWDDERDWLVRMTDRAGVGRPHAEEAAQ